MKQKWMFIFFLWTIVIYDIVYVYVHVWSKLLEKTSGIKSGNGAQIRVALFTFGVILIVIEQKRSEFTL